MTLFPLTSTSDSSTVIVTASPMGGSLLLKQVYLFLSSTNCWIRQGTAKLVTCVVKANLVDGDFLTIAAPTGTKVYEFDVAGNGVTAGNVQVNVSSDTTAAQVAARLRTAILANQTLEVTDNTDGTLTVVSPDLVTTFSENVANASFTITAATMTVTAADGSMFIPASIPITLNGDQGPQLGVLRDAADGKASLTRCKVT